MSMKYDAGMTQYHGNIATAIKRMCGHDKTAIELVKDASPAPLREHLKKSYKYNGAGDASSFYQGSPKDMKIEFSGESIILSWSQVAKFIRDNPSEIFDDYNALSDQPVCERRVENKNLSLDIGMLNLDVRTFNAFKRAGINTVEDYLNYPDKDKLRLIVGNRKFEEFLEASKPVELPTVQPERAAEIAEKFNYAVLTAELGDYLRHKEEQLRNEYMNFTANCGRIFAEAQEKLSGSNQYNGLFEKWFTAMGFAKTTVYRMIDIYKFRSSQIGTSEQAQLFDSLSKSLQYEVAKPSAPPELVEQVMNGDITTHKEYIELKKQLDEAEKKVALWSKTSTETSKENQQLRTERVTAMNRADNAERKNSELEQRIKELENRPVDVAVDVDELNRRVSEAANKMNSEMEHTLAAERRDFADTLNAKDDRIWELEDEVKKLKSSSASAPTTKILAFQMSMEQYKKLLEIVSGSDNSELYKVIQSVKIFS